VELVAAEPLVRDPIAISFDENGRLFVVEFPEYNHRHADWELNDHGRVRVLEDTNGDGKYDRSSIYVDGVASPTGVICYDGGIFVAAAPDILFCKDTTGDGLADVRKTVFTGFAISENRGGGARLNSFRWGLDNRIHLCTSFSGGEVRPAGDEDSKPVDVRNRGFAFDPRTLEFEATSGAGQHGLAMDDWGRFFLCNNSDPFRLLMYESRYAVRNPHVVAPPSYVSIAADGKFTKLFRISQVEPWRIERTRRRVAGLYRGSAEGGTPAGFFTSASGVTVYRGDAWPAEYRGSIFVCQPSGNLVHRARLEANNLELIARRADRDAEFVASRDNWFRPVELANAPDGTLYVVDMYRELIETALALPPDVLNQLQPGAGTNRGRIYRIAADPAEQRRLPRLGDASTAQLVALLEHRNGWHRDTAARLLYQRQDRAAVQSLKKLAVESELAEGRMTALYALAGLRALDTETVLRALKDGSENVRLHAVRLAEELVGTAAIQQKLITMTNDPSQLVRYQLAFSLGGVDSADRAEALSKLLLVDAADSWMRFAVLSSLKERASVVFQTLVDDDEFRKQTHGRALLMLVAGQIGAANQKEEVAAFAHCLEDLSRSDKELSHSLVQALLEPQSRAKRRRILASAGSTTSGLLAELLSEARVNASDESLGSQQRAEAIGTLSLGVFADDQRLFAELLDIRQPLAIQTAALNTLANFDDVAVADLLLEVWPRLSPQLRAVATEALLSRNTWLTAFLKAVETEKVAQRDLDPARISLLKKHPDKQIRERVQQLFQAGPSRRADVIKDYQQVLQLTGDAARGKAVFKKVCAACHKLEGVGAEVGEELTAIRNRGPSALLLNILDPNREVKPKFLTYVCQTDDGRVLTGMITAESANSLTLRRPDGSGSEVTIQRTQIEELRSTGLSFMPEGLEKSVHHQAMADLLEYLRIAR
jgi:putative membrane-bound dehydrogenase-like protein